MISESRSRLEHALEVHLAQMIDPSTIDIPDVETPETLFMQKHSYQKMRKYLSHEAQVLVDMILDLPDEFFTKQGRLHKGKFVGHVRKIMRRRPGYRPIDIEIRLREIGLYLLFQNEK